jgi:hypothetical protein
MQQQQLTVALSPPSVASPIHATSSESETEPPSYNAVHSLDSPLAPDVSPTNQGSLDETDDITVEGEPESPAAQPQPSRRDQ